MENHLGNYQRKTGARHPIVFHGLAFKLDIDDLRESRVLEIVKTLATTTQVRVIAVEPNIKALHSGHADVKIDDVRRAIDSAHIHVFLVGHQIAT
jgi:UDP-N-acetyl-D-mannosaminuronate dehydrogenase